MIKLAVSGCCGKMGKRIIALAVQDRTFSVVEAIERQAHPDVGKELQEITADPAPEIKVKDNPEVIKNADVLIEFTNPQATVEHLGFVEKYKKAVVIGTTGLTPPQIAEVKKASGKIAIVFSANMSMGVNLVFRLVKEAAQRLSKDYAVDIVEAHHLHKRDAPSGTAKRLAELIRQSQGRQDIRIDSIRKGEIVGEHQVRFSSPRDAIIIKHSAKTRDIFVQGALAAAKFVLRQRPGLYDMQDVIGA